MSLVDPIPEADAMIRHRLPTTPGRSESGASMVEFALVLPLVVFLSLGVVDLGRAYRLKARLTNAAREGGAYAQQFPSQVSPGLTCTDPSNVVYVSQHEEGSMNGFSVEVTNASSGGTPIAGCRTTAVSPGSRVTVVTSASFTPLTPGVSLLLGARKALRGVSEVVVQG